jgi:hypothetical protein
MTLSNNRMKNGFFPPVVSTHAPNGMRSREPERAGIAISKPSMAGVKSMASLNLIAVGPYSATAANPKKKPRVVPVNPLLLFPISFIVLNFSVKIED